MRINLFNINLGKQAKKASSGPSFQARSEENFFDILKGNLGKETYPPSAPRETVCEYRVKPGDTLWKIGMHLFQEDPYKIAKDNGIVNPDLIYPGQKLIIRKAASVSPQVVVASWYGKDYHNRPTASGEKFDMFKNTLAHRTLPLGTMVRLTNPENGRMAVGKVNDRGPFIEGREVDLSYGLAEQMGLIRKGIGKLIMEIL